MPAVIGGVLLVALLNYGQVAAEKRQQAEGASEKAGGDKAGRR